MSEKLDVKFKNKIPLFKELSIKFIDSGEALKWISSVLSDHDLVYLKMVTMENPADGYSFYARKNMNVANDKHIGVGKDGMQCFIMTLLNVEFNILGD